MLTQFSQDDPKEMQRSEDDLIAFTMSKFSDDGQVDNSLLALYPMTKVLSKQNETELFTCSAQELVNDFIVYCCFKSLIKSE